MYTYTLELYFRLFAAFSINIFLRLYSLTTYKTGQGLDMSYCPSGQAGISREL